MSIPLTDILYVEDLGNYAKIIRILGKYVLTRIRVILRGLVEELLVGVPYAAQMVEVLTAKGYGTF